MARSRFGALSVVLIAAVVAVAAVALRGSQSSSTTPAAVAGVPSGFASVVARATPSVVQVRSAHGLGSGIVYDDVGHIVTNAHVVAGSTHFKVTEANGSTHAATLQGLYPEGDLAVIDVTGASPPPARFADSSQVRPGDYALAIGNPLGFRSSVTMGIISATSRTVSEGSGVVLPSVLQTSAPINPGNSGGALVDTGGSVIGVPTLAAVDLQLGASAADGIGFAISSNVVRSIAPQLIQHGRVLNSGRAWLGLDLRSLAGGGTLVVAVDSGGPAAGAGIHPGDQLIRVAGKRASSVDAVALALAQNQPGATVPVQISDARGSRTVSVKLGQMPAAK